MTIAVVKTTIHRTVSDWMSSPAARADETVAIVVIAACVTARGKSYPRVTGLDKELALGKVKCLLVCLGHPIPCDLHDLQDHHHRGEHLRLDRDCQPSMDQSHPE
jgi:hypothetical protein